MNQQDNFDHDVSAALRHEADRLNTAAPDLAQVTERASAIRRRRMATAGVAAAAVLAVATPVAVTVAARDSAPTVPIAGPSATPSNGAEPTNAASEDPSQEPPALGVEEVQLTPQGAAESAGPGIAYVYRNNLVTENASGELPEIGGVFALTRASDEGWAVKWDGGESLFVGLVSDAGELISSWDYTAPQAFENMPPWRRQVRMTVFGLSPAPEGGPAETEKNSDGSLPRITGFGDGVFTQVYSADDEGTCSEVRRGSERLWQTCDFSLGEFSPNGKYVLGRPAYLDGLGDSSVAILDASNGDIVMSGKAAAEDAESDFYIGGSAWDSDSTLLSQTFVNGAWSLLRLSPADGLSVADFDLSGYKNKYEPPLTLETL